MDSLFSFQLTINFLVILLILAQAVPAPESIAIQGNNTDLQALLSFRAHVSDDPTGALSSWNGTNGTLSFCDWPGVTCGANRHPGRVTALSLGSYNLTGTLSPSLANLTFLRHLNLSGNKLHGRIPSDFGRLPNLRDLDLRYNYLEGDIPVSITHCSKLRLIFLNGNNLIGKIPANFSQCKGLNTLNLDRNQLVGTIPASLGSLSKLYLLALGTNQLTGGIPPSFGNLSSLAYLDLADNNLGGHIPDELGSLSTLKYLTLVVNSLSGEIPASLFNISSTYYFNVGNNNLTGVLPDDMGSTLPNLQFFYVFYNQLIGSFPTSLSNASGLQEFVLHGNMFVGPIPKDLGSLPNLTVLDIGRNQLEAGGWQFLTALANCTHLRVLDLYQNNLQGLLPSSVANLSTHLEWLRMSANQISGTIPAGIGRFNRLTVFQMELNLLRGSIPSTIGMLENLHELVLSDNQLQGQIPASIGNLSQLNDFGLADNKLQGSIPPTIGNLSSLASLNLSYNELGGTIPGGALSQLSSLSQYLDVSHNMLTGELPSQISSLINLNVLDVSENRLSGNIPGALGACQVLERVFMQGNLFEGIIPPALSALKGIQVLDLSRNNLSGPIPEFFRRSNLLRYLNLSFNNLEGQVPKDGVFGNASAISVVGNNKLCGGIQELHLQPCYSFPGKNARRSSPMKIIVPVVATLIVLVLLGCLAYYIRQRRTKANPVSPPQHEPFIQVSYDDIYKATDGFSSSNLVGAGSFGSVYRGTMDSDPTRVVAIKVLNLDQRGADRSFVAECDSLRVIRHRNLVNIVTVCSSIDRNGDGFKALIFEYMENGSLDEWLHPGADAMNANPKRLSLVQRLNIAMDMALALDYLHNQCQTPIVHRDLKPSNVLLDRDMTAHVGDFGLSRFLDTTTSSSQDTTMTSGIKGSIGYIAPKYGMGGTVSTEGDVYSYGVLLLEIFTGMRPTDNLLPSDVNLHKYVEMAYPDHVLSIVDPHIVLETDENAGSVSRETNGFRDLMKECMVSVLKIGLLCSNESPAERMKMVDVMKELRSVKKMLEDGRYSER